MTSTIRVTQQAMRTVPCKRERVRPSRTSALISRCGDAETTVGARERTELKALEIARDVVGSTIITAQAGFARRAGSLVRSITSALELAGSTT